MAGRATPPPLLTDMLAAAMAGELGTPDDEAGPPSPTQEERITALWDSLKGLPPAEWRERYPEVLAEVDAINAERLATAAEARRIERLRYAEPEETTVRRAHAYRANSEEGRGLIGRLAIETTEGRVFISSPSIDLNITSLPAEALPGRTITVLELEKGFRINFPETYGEWGASFLWRPSGDAPSSLCYQAERYHGLWDVLIEEITFGVLVLDDDIV